MLFEPFDQTASVSRNVTTSTIATALGVSRATVYRVLAEQTAEDSLISKVGSHDFGPSDHTTVPLFVAQRPTQAAATREPSACSR
jgi:Helix-turn-helix domain of resolvase